MPPVTKNLLIINALVYVAIYINEPFMIQAFALFCPPSVFFRPWQPLTHLFMHGGFFHLFLNMWSLWMFGSVLESSIGSRKFSVFYFLSGFGAAGLHLLVQHLQAGFLLNAAGAGAYYALLNTPTVGASGAIYGLLIGYAMLYPDSILRLVFPPIALKAKWFVLIFGALELITGIVGTADGVAHFAHLGGMVIGLLLILFWRKTGRIYDREAWF